jgi:hypothetical protein
VEGLIHSRGRFNSLLPSKDFQSAVIIPKGLNLNPTSLRLISDIKPTSKDLLLIDVKNPQTTEVGLHMDTLINKIDSIFLNTNSNSVDPFSVVIMSRLYVDYAYYKSTSLSLDQKNLISELTYPKYLTLSVDNKK